MFVDFLPCRIRLRRFWNDEDGAVTVDWVVLTGSVIGVTLAIIALIGVAFEPGATNIGTELGDYTINTTFE